MREIRDVSSMTAGAGHAAGQGAPHPHVTAVLVTYNRAGLLEQCLADLSRVAPAPDRLVIIDNASTDDTADVVTRATTSLSLPEVRYIQLAENTGGSGGYYEGVRRALREGTDFVWLMDDDVELLPSSLGSLMAWTHRYDVVQGMRYDYDGGHFTWQPMLTRWSYVPTLRGPGFGIDGSASINSGTFEGMLVRASVFEVIGLPDPRFFIVWDDSVFGWLADTAGLRVGYVAEYTLRRRREPTRIQVAGRQVNSSSARHRYYVVRNRGLVKNYARARGRYRAAPFLAGTAVIVVKEVLRLVGSGSVAEGVADVVRGVRAARDISRDEAWRPMPPWPADRDRPIAASQRPD